MFKKDYLTGVVFELLKRLQVAPQGGQAFQNAIGTAIGEITRYANSHALPPEPEQPAGAITISRNWLQLAMSELELLNSESDNAICSVVEAHWKTYGITNPWSQANPTKFYFRGEHNAHWPLIASAQRRGLAHDPNDLLTVTDDEIDALRRFQTRVQSDPGLFAAVFPDGRLLSLESAEWWCLMQHYEGGTRMIDVTSSLMCGLYFACADWTGTIDVKADGKLYLFPWANWRPAEVDPQIVRGANVGGSDQLHATVDRYYDVHAHAQTARFRQAFYRNDRLIAQDGYFLWQPEFSNPLNIGQHFTFRIPGSRKISILRELYSSGYTADRIIRRPMSAIAHDAVCATIGVPP